MNPIQFVQKWLFSFRPLIEVAIPLELALLLLEAVLVWWMVLFDQSMVVGLSQYGIGIDMDGEYKYEDTMLQMEWHMAG